MKTSTCRRFKALLAIAWPLQKLFFLVLHIGKLETRWSKAYSSTYNQMISSSMLLTSTIRTQREGKIGPTFLVSTSSELTCREEASPPITARPCPQAVDKKVAEKVLLLLRRAGYDVWLIKYIRHHEQMSEYRVRRNRRRVRGLGRWRRVCDYLSSHEQHPIADIEVFNSTRPEPQLSSFHRVRHMSC